MFGNDQQTELTQSREERIFLNFEAPSQCRGNVTAWRYCHYDSQEDDTRPYGAKFIVYRRSSDDYVPVPGSIITIRLESSDVASFNCREFVLEQSFEILENDVIAACVQDDSSTNPLYLIGEADDGPERLYHYDRGGHENCRDDQLATVETSRSEFRKQEEWRLYLYADIGKLSLEYYTCLLYFCCSC